MSYESGIKARIIVDDREKNSSVPYELERLGVNVDYTHLEVGDYIPLPDVVVERKSIRDMVRSIYDGRLFMQASQMLKHYSKALIIIEYDTRLEELVDNKLVVYGALASLALEFNIPLINSYSSSDTAYILLALARRRKEYNKPMLKKIKKPDTLKEQQLALISSLPGIGEKLASKLLERFGSPIEVFNAKINELERIIGYKRAERVKNVLESKYKERREVFDTKWFE